MGQSVHSAPAGYQVQYEPRRPEEATLYQVAQVNVESLLAQVHTKTGAQLPETIKDEFDPFSNAASSMAIPCALLRMRELNMIGSTPHKMIASYLGSVRTQ